MTRLRAARIDRGWSQSRLIHAIACQATSEGLMTPGTESMRVMVSRWENGHTQPDETYRRLLCAVYDADEAALGIVAAPTPGGAGASVHPPEASAFLVAHLQRTLAELASADNHMGSAAVLPAAESEAHLLSTLAAGTSGPLRNEILMLASRYAEFCGWLRQDAGDTDAAQRWSDRALDLAQELGAAHEVSYVLMRKSNLEIEVGHPVRAIGLADAALRQGKLLTPQLRAVALRQRALGHSMTGDVRGCLSALDAARDEVLTADAPDERASYVSPAYIGSEAGLSLIRLHQPAKAEQVLRSALANWPTGQERDRGHCLARLSTALADLECVEESAEALQGAIEVARTTSSERLRSEIRGVGRRLSQWRKVDSVGEVANAISSMR